MAEQPALLRALGPSMATAVVVGAVIGSGIFLKPGNIAAEGGRFSVIISVWVFGGLLCILGALCFAELATMLPHAGGLYVYLRQAYGRLVAFLFGWTELLIARPAGIGALAVAFVGSLTLFINWQISPWLQFVMASVLILGMGWVNIVGVVWGGRVQLVVTIVKATFLGLVALSPWLLAPVAGWQVEAANYHSTVLPSQASLAGQIGAVLLAVMWAYNGWEAITPLTEEVRQPQRNIPLALFVGIGLLILLYVAANIAYHGVLSMAEMKAAGDHAAEHMLLKLAGRPGQAAMSLVIMCSTFGAINTNLLASPRVTFAMGRDGVFFRSLGLVHARYRTPVIAILVTSSMAVFLIAAVAVGKLVVGDVAASNIDGLLLRRIVESLHNDSVFELLTNLVIFSLSVFYLLAVLAVIILRIRFPDLERPYRVWCYPLVPIVFLAVYAWFLTQVYNSSPLESRAGVGFILLGIPVYYAYGRWRRSGSA